MVIHSILEVHADPCGTCPNHDVGGALQLMKGKKNPIKKQDSIGTNTNQYYLGEFDCTLFDHHKLPNIDLCKKSKQDCHTKRKRQQESTSRYYIQHSQHNPFNGNMEQTSNKFLFLFHHVQLPNKLHTTNCLNTALYTLRTVLSRYTLFYQGELDPSLNGEKFKEGILSAIRT